MAGLLGGIASVGKKFGGALGVQDAPDPTIVPLDAETQGLLNESTDRALRPSDEYAAAMNAGAADGAGALGQSQQQGQQATQRLGGDAGGFGEALRGSYAAKSQQNIGRLLEKNKYKAELQRADQMKKMSMAAMAQQRVATQNYAMLTEAYNQQEMSRAQFVSQLFQLGGTAMAVGAANQRKANATDSIVSGPGRMGGYAPSGPNYGGSQPTDQFGNGGMEYA